MKKVNIENARSKEVAKELKRIQEKGFCPFCSKKYLKEEHRKPIIMETDNWIVTENRWPYENALVHLLLIHKKHIENISEMTEKAWLELKSIITKLPKKFSIPGATLLFRYGNTIQTGSTVAHLHAQLISGNPKTGKAVITRVG